MDDDHHLSSTQVAAKIRTISQKCKKKCLASTLVAGFGSGISINMNLSSDGASFNSIGQAY